MVDKKLSEFPDISADDVAKLICLYFDENNAIKNGKVDFATLNALLVHKDGQEEITGAKTFSGQTVFSGQATFNQTINADISGSADKATRDGNGNNIVNTYATKNELISVMKTGFVVPYGGSTSPSGWLICDGSAVSRTTYSNLFSVIGTTYGAGNGSTTFNIPNISSIVKSVNTNVPIKGNGIALGFTNGQENAGLTSVINGSYQILEARKNSYGATVGSSYGSDFISGNKAFGLTTDTSKSGIIGTVTRSVVNFKFIIKY